MADKNKSNASHDGGRFSSEDCILIEIREEDTQPGTVSESYRKHLRQKYGRKEPPANGGPEKPK